MEDTKYPTLKSLCQGLKLTEKVLQTPIKSVITVDADGSLLKSFKILMKNNILSAPVSDNGKWVGFLDVRDLVSYVNHLFESQPKPRRKSWEKKNIEGEKAKESKDDKQKNLARVVDIAV